MEYSNWRGMQDENLKPAFDTGTTAAIVDDSPEKRQIIALLDTVISCYRKINCLLKSSSRNGEVIKSRVVYGALRKDIGSAVYHARLQKEWIITERDSGRY